MHAPEFWRRRGWQALALEPAAQTYAAAGALRHALARPMKAAVPVICVGNLVAGGAGKTPVTLELARLLADARLWRPSRRAGAGRSRRP